MQLEKKYVRLEPGDDVLTVGMNRAIALLNEPAKGRRAAAPAAPLRELGRHPKDNEPVQLLPGRFGPYVKHGKLNASLPKARDAGHLHAGAGGAAPGRPRGQAAPQGGGRPGAAGARQGSQPPRKPAAKKRRPRSRLPAKKAARRRPRKRS